MKSSDANYLDLLKLFTVLVVVLNHSMTEWNWYKIFSNDFQMPLFMFITGYVYYLCRLDLGKYKSINNLIVKKYKRLLLPFMGVALFYYVPVLLLINHERFEGLNYFEVVFKNIIFGLKVDYLWYVYALFIMFVLFYIGEMLLKKFLKLNNPILIIGLLVFLHLLSNKLPEIFQINHVTRYLVFFYLGYATRSINNYLKDLVEKKITKYSIIILILCLIISFVYLIDFRLIHFPNFVNNYTFLVNVTLYVLNLLKSISITFVMYLLFRKLISRYKKMCGNRIIKYLSDESYNLYLYHRPIVDIVYFIFALKLSNNFVVMISFFAAVSISLIISYLVKFMNNTLLKRKNE